MTGQVHWFPVVMVIVGMIAVVWAAYHYTRRASADLSTHEMNFVCPDHETIYAATLVRNDAEGRWVGVKRCERFDDPLHVNCDKNCVKLLNVQQTMNRELGLEPPDMTRQ